MVLNVARLGGLVALSPSLSSSLGVYPMPAASVLARISKLRTVAVPTVDIPIDPTCRYDNIVYINGFDQSFRVEGGVNAPKVVSCIGSDGLRRRQLIKVCTGTHFILV